MALFCEPSSELQESLGASWPEIPKKSEKKKSPDFSDFFETFPRLFGR